jgi:hypothetical protein
MEAASPFGIRHARAAKRMAVLAFDNDPAATIYTRHIAQRSMINHRDCSQREQRSDVIVDGIVEKRAVHLNVGIIVTIIRIG